MRLWWWWGYDIGIISYVGRFVCHVELCCYRAASSVQTVVWSRRKVETNDGVTRRHKLRGELERRGGVNPKREKPETRSQERKNSSRESTKSIIDFWYTVYPICTCSYYLFGGKRWSIVIERLRTVLSSPALEWNKTANSSRWSFRYSKCSSAPASPVRRPVVTCVFHSLSLEQHQLFIFTYIDTPLQCTRQVAFRL